MDFQTEMIEPDDRSSNPQKSKQKNRYQAIQPILKTSKSPSREVLGERLSDVQDENDDRRRSINSDDKRRSINNDKRRSLNRRVSFAETYEVKEFIKENANWLISHEGSELNEESRLSNSEGEKEIAGLSSLLTAQIQGEVSVTPTEPASTSYKANAYGPLQDIYHLQPEATSMLETEAGIGLGEEKVHTKSFLAQLTAMGGPARNDKENVANASMMDMTMCQPGSSSFRPISSASYPSWSTDTTCVYRDNDDCMDMTVMDKTTSVKNISQSAMDTLRVFDSTSSAMDVTMMQNNSIITKKRNDFQSESKYNQTTLLSGSDQNMSMTVVVPHGVQVFNPNAAKEMPVFTDNLPVDENKINISPSMMNTDEARDVSFHRKAFQPVPDNRIITNPDKVEKPSSVSRTKSPSTNGNINTSETVIRNISTHVTVTKPDSAMNSAGPDDIEMELTSCIKESTITSLNRPNNKNITDPIMRVGSFKGNNKSDRVFSTDINISKRFDSYTNMTKDMLSSTRIHSDTNMEMTACLSPIVPVHSTHHTQAAPQLSADLTDIELTACVPSTILPPPNSTHPNSSSRHMSIAPDATEIPAIISRPPPQVATNTELSETLDASAAMDITMCNQSSLQKNIVRNKENYQQDSELIDSVFLDNTVEKPCSAALSIVKDSRKAMSILSSDSPNKMEETCMLSGPRILRAADESAVGALTPSAFTSQAKKLSKMADSSCTKSISAINNPAEFSIHNKENINMTTAEPSEMEITKCVPSATREETIKEESDVRYSDNVAAIEMTFCNDPEIICVSGDSASAIQSGRSAPQLTFDTSQMDMTRCEEVSIAHLTDSRGIQPVNSENISQGNNMHKTRIFSDNEKIIADRSNSDFSSASALLLSDSGQEIPDSKHDAASNHGNSRQTMSFQNSESENRLTNSVINPTTTCTAYDQVDSSIKNKPVTTCVESVRPIRQMVYTNETKAATTCLDSIKTITYSNESNARMTCLENSGQTKAATTCLGCVKPITCNTQAKAATISVDSVKPITYNTQTKAATTSVDSVKPITYNTQTKAATTSVDSVKPMTYNTQTKAATTSVDSVKPITYNTQTKAATTSVDSVKPMTYNAQTKAATTSVDSMKPMTYNTQTKAATTSVDSTKPMTYNTQTKAATTSVDSMKPMTYNTQTKAATTSVDSMKPMTYNTQTKAATTSVDSVKPLAYNTQTKAETSGQLTYASERKATTTCLESIRPIGETTSTSQTKASTTCVDSNSPGDQMMSKNETLEGTSDSERIRQNLNLSDLMQNKSAKTRFMQRTKPVTTFPDSIDKTTKARTTSLESIRPINSLVGLNTKSSTGCFQSLRPSNQLNATLAILADASNGPSTSVNVGLESKMLASLDAQSGDQPYAISITQEDKNCSSLDASSSRPSDATSVTHKDKDCSPLVAQTGNRFDTTSIIHKVQDCSSLVTQSGTISDTSSMTHEDRECSRMDLTVCGDYSETCDKENTSKVSVNKESHAKMETNSSLNKENISRIETNVSINKENSTTRIQTNTSAVTIPHSESRLRQDGTPGTDNRSFENEQRFVEEAAQIEIDMQTCNIANKSTEVLDMAGDVICDMEMTACATNTSTMRSTSPVTNNADTDKLSLSAANNLTLSLADTTDALLAPHQICDVSYPNVDVSEANNSKRKVDQSGCQNFDNAPDRKKCRHQEDHSGLPLEISCSGEAQSTLSKEVSMMKADCLQSVSHISGQSLSMGIYETSAPDLVTMSECGSPTQKSITSQYDYIRDVTGSRGSRSSCLISTSSNETREAVSSVNSDDFINRSTTLVSNSDYDTRQTLSSMTSEDGSHSDGTDVEVDSKPCSTKPHTEDVKEESVHSFRKPSENDKDETLEEMVDKDHNKEPETEQADLEDLLMPEDGEKPQSSLLKTPTSSVCEENLHTPNKMVELLNECKNQAARMEQELIENSPQVFGKIYSLSEAKDMQLMHTYLEERNIKLRGTLNDLVEREMDEDMLLNLSSQNPVLLNLQREVQEMRVQCDQLREMKMRLEQEQEEKRILQQQNQDARRNHIQQTVANIYASCSVDIVRWNTEEIRLDFVRGTMVIKAEVGKLLSEKDAVTFPNRIIEKLQILPQKNDSASYNLLVHQYLTHKATAVCTPCKETTQLLKLLPSLSKMALDADQLMEDIYSHNAMHFITVNDAKLSVEFSSLKAFAKFLIQFNVGPDISLSEPMDWHFTGVIGKISSVDVHRVLDPLGTTENWFRKAVTAVDDLMESHRSQNVRKVCRTPT